MPRPVKEALMDMLYEQEILLNLMRRHVLYVSLDYEPQFPLQEVASLPHQLRDEADAYINELDNVGMLCVLNFVLQDFLEEFMENYQ